MEPIYIPRLTRAPERTEVIKFNQVIPGLETLMPVQGWIRVKHQGNYLEVDAKVDTIITLTCDRCLQQYNHRLSISPSEFIWLNEAADEIDPILFERDITPDDLIETLPPQGYFDPATWLYEQLSLELPQRQLCDSQCQGIQLPETNLSKPAIDHRWAGLKALKDQLPERN